MPRYPEIANLSQLARILRCRQEYVKKLVPLGLPRLEPDGRNWRFPTRAVLEWIGERGMAYGETVRAATVKAHDRSKDGPLSQEEYDRKQKGFGKKKK